MICLICAEPIADDAEPWMVVLITVVDGDGKGSAGHVHAECQALGMIGHEYGVCACTGWDTTSRAAALELWQRIKTGKKADVNECQ